MLSHRQAGLQQSLYEEMRIKLVFKARYKPKFFFAADNFYDKERERGPGENGKGGETADDGRNSPRPEDTASNAGFDGLFSEAANRDGGDFWWVLKFSPRGTHEKKGWPISVAIVLYRRLFVQCYNVIMTYELCLIISRAEGIEMSMI